MEIGEFADKGEEKDKKNNKETIMKGIPPPIQRQSNFELLRLISQLAIVFYHILMLFVYPTPTTESIIFKALWLPLHVGVVVFVLLSGYFTIRPSSKGFIKLFAIFAIYNLPEVIWNVSHAEGIHNTLHQFLFLSNSHFWFVKTYIFLYLLSPMVNEVLHKATDRQLIYMIVVLAFISQYMALTKGDINMVDGKNVTNFIFLYTVGYSLNRFQRYWKQMGVIKLLLTYLLLNVSLVVIFVLSNENAVGQMIWNFFFPYSSMGLLINSIILFVLIGKKPFQSKTVNYMASSAFAIYLLHANRPYLVGLLGKGTYAVMELTDNVFVLIGGCMVLTFVTILICIVIDKLLTPIWNMSNRIGVLVNTKIGF